MKEIHLKLDTTYIFTVQKYLPTVPPIFCVQKYFHGSGLERGMKEEDLVHTVD